MHFASPWLLTLLGCAAALALLARRDHVRRRARLLRLVDAGLVDAHVTGAAPQRRTLIAVAAVVAAAAAVIAAAGFVVAGAPRLLPRRGLDVVFVVDVSRSMRARDVQPDRLERTKAELGVALDTLAEHRVGLIAFAGTAFVQCPLTTDTDTVRLFLNDLRPETVPQGGTDLAAGLEVARNAFAAEDEAAGIGARREGAAGRVVVVISDGEDHALVEGGSLASVGKELRALGATVVVIGVGSALGEPIPLLSETGEMSGYLKDRSGQTVVSRMNPDILRAASSAVEGVFVDGTSRPDLGMAEVFAKVASLEKRELEARTVRDDVDHSAWFAALALIFTLVWLLVPERARRRDLGAVDTDGTVGSTP